MVVFRDIKTLNMKELLTKEIQKKLKSQYSLGFELANLEVIAKIFNPYGLGTWYIINQNPNNPDELFAIVDWFELEIGGVSLSELQSVKVPPFGLPLERDKYFEKINALTLLSQIKAARVVSTSNFALGGEINSLSMDKPTFSPNNVFVGYNRIPVTPIILE